MISTSPMSDYFCTECDSRSIEVIGPLTAQAIVVCGCCGEPITSWAGLLKGLQEAQRRSSEGAWATNDQVRSGGFL